MYIKPTIWKTIVSLALPLPLFYLITSFACENALFCFVKKNEFFLTLMMSPKVIQYWIQIVLLFFIIYLTWSWLQKRK